MARLCVNISHTATLRELGKQNEPDPIGAALFSEVGGADGIVCTLNENLNPVTERDARMLKEVVKTHYNIQIPPTEKMIGLAMSIGPDMITLISGKRPGSTPGGGLDILGHFNKLAKVVQSIREQDILVSVQVEPLIQQAKAVAKSSADYIELHMGSYVSAGSLNERSDQLEAIASMAAASSKLELGVSVGCGLNFQNIIEVAETSFIEEVNIGHAIIARSMWVGMEAAVRDMAALVR